MIALFGNEKFGLIALHHMLQRLGSFLMKPLLPVRRAIYWLWSLQNRERERLASEMEQVRGLTQLLLKQRNGYRWSEGDRRKIRAQLRKLAQLSPYLVLFVSPGGFFALPVLAWWIDRRRQRQVNESVRKTVE